MGSGQSCSTCPQHLGKTQKNRKGHKGQRGGATYEVSMSNPIVTSGGVPLAVNNQIDPYCTWTTRGAQLGGQRRTQKQRNRGQKGGCGCGLPRQQVGGGCGCSRQQIGGGAGTGGYGFALTNDLGKVYSALPVGNCPVQPVATPLTSQSGGGGSPAPIGSDAALRTVVSYPSGYSLGHPYSTVNDSAHFLEPVRYDRSCMGGGARQKRRQNRKRTSSRK